MGDVLGRAQRDMKRGEPWLARDRLRSTLRERPADPALWDALAQVLAHMHDLPAAGAAWFLSGRSSQELGVAEAVASFCARYPRPQVRARVLNVHAPLTSYAPAAQERLRDLQREVEGCGGGWRIPARPHGQSEPPPLTIDGSGLERSRLDRCVVAVAMALGCLIAVGGAFAIAFNAWLWFTEVVLH